MTTIKSARLGEIELEEDQKTIEFKDGLFGFDDLTKYVLLQNEGEDYGYLQSLEDEEVCFVVIDPFVYFEEYEFVLSDRLIEILDLEKKERVNVLTVLNINKDNENEAKMTVNLKAPLVINEENFQARQVVINDSYLVRQPLEKKVIEQEEKAV